MRLLLFGSFEPLAGLVAQIGGHHEKLDKISFHMVSSIFFYIKMLYAYCATELRSCSKTGEPYEAGGVAL